MLSITQLVTSVPPRVCGVGDYALRLAYALRTLGIDSAFLAAQEGDGVLGRDIDGFAARSLPKRSAGALEEALLSSATETVLLHYSGYGYAKRGAPVWLVQGLRRWKAGASRRRLVVMFHEVWAFGPPWTSSFWLFPLQRALAAAILSLADAFLTSTDLYAARLRRLASDRSPAGVLPVLSNIGEPTEPQRLADREPLAVVFGQHPARKRVYAHFGDFVPALQSAGIQGVLDVGPPIDDQWIARSPLPVTRCGYLDIASASATMLRARVGLLEYPFSSAAKSGILAAYTAHGLVPLIRSARGSAPDGLRHGVNLVRTGEPLPKLRAVAQPLATAAHLWYRKHSVERTAACFARTLRPLGTAC
jgi:hypothetical protein